VEGGGEHMKRSLEEQTPVNDAETQAEIDEIAERNLPKVQGVEDELACKIQQEF